MKEALATGSKAWWRTKTGPEWIREKDGNYRVTFWWRDPQGNETHSPIRRVWVYITGVTDHHQNAQPQTMARIAGTDVWRWSTALSANWRGSYCFIPTERDDVFALLRRAKRPIGTHCVKAGDSYYRRRLPTRLIRKAGGEDVVMRFQRWKCRMRPFSRDGIVLKRRTRRL